MGNLGWTIIQKWIVSVTCTYGPQTVILLVFVVNGQRVIQCHKKKIQPSQNKFRQTDRKDFKKKLIKNQLQIDDFVVETLLWFYIQYLSWR